MKLKGKNIIITGASQGIGLMLCEKFREEGANVLSCSRNSEYKCDVSKESDVKKFIGHCQLTFGKIDVLINNAGVYGPIGKIDEIDLEEWKKALEINLYGPIYTMREILPLFKQQGYGKIINMSGGGATAGMPNFSLYAAAKTALVRLTETISGEVKEFGIDVNAVAPGAFNTRLLKKVIDSGEDIVGKDFYEKSVKQQSSGGSNVDKMCNLFVWLCSDRSNGLTGKLISAQWDDWKNFEPNISELNSSDIYTLRRIVVDPCKL